MTQPKLGDVERSVGFAGRFIVYYRWNGKRYWDAMYAPTAEQAEADFKAMATELGMKAEVEKVEVRDVGSVE
jgi:hypothetical protein